MLRKGSSKRKEQACAYIASFLLSCAPAYPFLMCTLSWTA